MWLRSALYALRRGFLIRPFAIALVFGTAGAVLSFAEEYAPALNAWIPNVLFPAQQHPQAALTILACIASSIMTVVSIVFAILLVTRTLASPQFSPRILVSFVRDKPKGDGGLKARSQTPQGVRRRCRRTQGAGKVGRRSSETAVRNTPLTSLCKGRRQHKILKFLARPKRFELLTPRFVVWCSIQLSYGRADRRRAQGSPFVEAAV